MVIIYVTTLRHRPAPVDGQKSRNIINSAIKLTKNEKLNNKPIEHTNNSWSSEFNLCI